MCEKLVILNFKTNYTYIDKCNRIKYNFKCKKSAYFYELFLNNFILIIIYIKYLHPTFFIWKSDFAISAK